MPHVRTGRLARHLSWIAGLAVVLLAWFPVGAHGVGVWVDAGHGGSDPGAVYRSGSEQLMEKDLNLSTSLIVRTELRRYGYNVGMTRTTDVFVPLSERVTRAQAWGADLFVSIHFNAAASTSANGLETLYSGRDAVTGVLSARLAELVQREMVKDAGLRDRGTVRRDGLYVLSYAGMPAIIVEGGFITNEGDRAVISDPAFQRTLGRAVARGVSQFIAEGHLDRKVPVRYSRGSGGAETCAPRSATYTYLPGETYPVWGYFQPRRDINRDALVRVLAYRYERRADGSMGWVYKHSHRARVTNPSGSVWSKYSTGVELPSPGRWRMRVRYYGDAHTHTTTSSYRTVTVLPKPEVAFSRGAGGRLGDAPRLHTTVLDAGETYRTWGYFKPRRDTNGDALVRVLAYRYEQRADGSMGWVYKHSHRARVTNPSGLAWSKYNADITLPQDGRWRVRVRYYEDSRTARTTSGYRELEVR